MKIKTLLFRPKTKKLQINFFISPNININNVFTKLGLIMSINILMKLNLRIKVILKRGQ
jgi:hypothetical protein